jgi:hypothetical protein
VGTIRITARHSTLGAGTADIRVRPPEIGGYSVFDSALDRMHNAKWLFHQEKATLHDVGDVDN